MVLKIVNDNKLSNRLIELFLERHGEALRKSEQAGWALPYIQRHALRCNDDAANIVELKPMASKILNIGGAPYILEFFLKNNGLKSEIVTLDLEPERFSALITEMNCKVNKVNVENKLSWVPLGDGPFDVICLCEVFEHLRVDIISTLEFISMNLKPDGVLYLTTPNGVSFVRVLQNLFKRRTGPSVEEWRKISTVGHMGHVREYAPIETIELLSMSGLKVKKVMYRNRNTSSSFKGRSLQVIRNFISKVFNSLADDLIVVANRNS